ncbi:unnamed protein product [Rotaria socialis]|uniref:PABS domain-containing protein n=4 Tax=Rotaria socialis TaxID=392032 RepID=A0A817Q604_9BILA|nr:unnamed protein product [Rotaria socialis]
MHIIVHLSIKIVRILHVVFSLIIRLLFSFHRENILVKQGSKYNYSIIISQCGTKRIMRFNNLSNGAQAQLDLNRVDYPFVEYIQLMIISLTYYPFLLDNKNILVIGLGGGTLPRAIRKLYPTCSITIIEIDPLVDEMAKKYFYFKEDSNMKVIINDGRKFLKSLLNSINYDIILLDAYDSMSGLPSHMKTQEFFLELKYLLNPNGGLFIVNLVCIYQSYINVRLTIDSVFGQNNIITFRSTDFVNMIVVASAAIENFPLVNQKSNIINDIQEKLLIDINSSLKRKQKQIHNQNLSGRIYRDDMKNLENEQQMSLIEFVNIV